MTHTTPALEPVGCIQLSGRFDFSVFRRFRESYEPMLEDPGLEEIRVDLAAVEHMDSAALGMLLLLREKAVERGKRVSLSRCTPAVRQILTIANFDQLFEVLE